MTTANGEISGYVGVLGGFGAKATARLYERLCAHVVAIAGPDHTCPVRLIAIDFAEINALLPDNIAAAAARLAPHLQEIDAAPTVCTILANNTLHRALDLLAPRLVKPVAHIGELVRVALQACRPRRVALLTTEAMHRAGYLQGFVPEGIEVVALDAATWKQLEACRQAHVAGAASAQAAALYQRLCDTLEDVDAWVVACTEHAVALAPWHSDPRIVDTMELQCAFAVARLALTVRPDVPM